jgi:hypothetical protein
MAASRVRGVNTLLPTKVTQDVMQNSLVTFSTSRNQADMVVASIASMAGFFLTLLWYSEAVA